MSDFTLSVQAGPGANPGHDPSAAIFEGGELRFGIEEERLTRIKHASGSFPIDSIQACLDHVGIDMGDVETIVVPVDPTLMSKAVRPKFGIKAREIWRDTSPTNFWYAAPLELSRVGISLLRERFRTVSMIEQRIDSEFEDCPPITTQAHHRCHAASAFAPSGFDNALVLTIDGAGEYDSTVVWKGDTEGLSRLKSYPFSNSLGRFYGAITDFLGYNRFNGEGKVMGLAPYGSENSSIESALRSHISTGVDYDVSAFSWGRGVSKLEDVLGFGRREPGTEFSQREKDLAFTAQRLLEEIVTNIVSHYLAELDVDKVCLAGGVALNCKMNQQIRTMEGVDDVFVQPVANDAGLVLGGGWLESETDAVPEGDTVYYGSGYTNREIRSIFDELKVDYNKPDDLVDDVASRIADGALVGWFQGRMEMGPRALGNRSILADPRTIDSRDNVNRYVKHREEWRPFAPSMLEEAAPTYLEDGQCAPFMIQTFDTKPDTRDDIAATIHPGDNSTRPQTVRREQNTRYYELIEAFESLTGVPVLLNTSFNDHGEPIVRTPREAIKDFYGMGLDALAINDFVVTKE